MTDNTPARTHKRCEQRKKVFMAHEGDGSLWVADGGNLRTLHVDNNGKELGSTEYIVASYSSAVSIEPGQRTMDNRYVIVDDRHNLRWFARYATTSSPSGSYRSVDVLCRCRQHPKRLVVASRCKLV